MSDEHAVSRPGVRRPGAMPPGRLELAAVGCLTLAFALAAARLTSWDQPSGDGWNRYLGNAIAIREQEWSGYLRWRGPVHAWLCLGLMPLTGTLVRASQLISFLSATAALPLTWLLGRRLFGPWVGLVGVLLLASWPDLRVFARFSSPYALDAVLLTAAACLALTAATPSGRPTQAPAGSPVRSAGLAALAGAFLGIGIATDLRFLALTATITLGSAAASIGANGWRRPLMVSIALPSTALAVGYGLIATLPVELYTLGEQVALQRDLAASFVRECGRRGPVAPLVSDALGPCGQALLDVNLRRAGVALGLSTPAVGMAALFGLVGVAGLLGWSRDELWRRAFVVLPLVPLLPSLLIIVMQHRYIMPVAPFVALAVAAGLVRLETTIVALFAHRAAAQGATGAPQRGLGRVAVVGLLAGVAVAWGRSPTTLLARFEVHSSASDPAAEAAKAVRRGYRPGDRVLDCANGNLRARLYPIPVEQRAPARNTIPAVCATLLAGPASVSTWILVRDGSSHPGWSEGSSTGEAAPDLAIRLLYGSPNPAL